MFCQKSCVSSRVSHFIFHQLYMCPILFLFFFIKDFGYFRRFKKRGEGGPVMGRG